MPFAVRKKMMQKTDKYLEKCLKKIQSMIIETTTIEMNSKFSKEKIDPTKTSSTTTEVTKFKLLIGTMFSLTLLHPKEMKHPLLTSSECFRKNSKQLRASNKVAVKR